MRLRLQWSLYLSHAPCLKVIVPVYSMVQIHDCSLMGLSDVPDKWLQVGKNELLLG